MRKSKKKMRVVVALEERDGKSGRGYAREIEDYSNESLKPLFDTHRKEHAIYWQMVGLAINH